MSLNLQSNSITPTQALTNNFGVAHHQLVNVGGILYYITKREITLLSGDAHLVIYKSDATGLIWTLAAHIGGGGGPGTLSEFGVAVIGTKIYVADHKNSAPQWFLGVWTYDTVGNTLTGPGANNGPQTNNDTGPVSVSATNAGTLLIAYTKSSTGASYNVVSYNPGTDTWGAPVSLNATVNCQTVAQIHHSGSDKTVIFYNIGSTQDLGATIVDATPTVLITTGAIYTFGFFSFNTTWGVPAITSDAPSGNTSVALPFKSAFNECTIAYVDLATGAHTTELVDNSSDLPAGLQVSVYTVQDQGGFSAFDFGGVLYCVFAVDNGTLNNASSQCFLYAKARVGGVWSSLQLLFTSALSREMLQPFQTDWTAAGPAILVNLWDPTQDIISGPGAGGLTSFILLPAVPTISKTRYGVKTLLQPIPANQIPYRLCVNNNRLHCILPDNTGIFSDFVYYLGKENNQDGYWYRYVIDPSAMISEEDGNLYAGFGDAGVGNLFNLDLANVSTFAGTNITINLLFPMSKNEINQRKDMFNLRFHIDTGNTALALTGYTDFGAGTAFSLGNIVTNGVQEFNILVQNTNFNLAKRIALQLAGTVPYFKLIDWSLDYAPRPEPLSFLRIATNYGLAAKKRLRTVPIVIDTRGNPVTINVIADGVSLGAQSFTTSERTTVYYLMSTDVFATDLIINIQATTGNTFEFYEAPAPVNVEVLPVPKLFDQIGPVEFERNGELFEFRVRMLATTNTITYNVYMDDILVRSAISLPVNVNVDQTYGPFKMPKGIRGSVCRIEFLSSGGVFYRWNCKLKYYTGGVKSDLRQVNIQDKSVGLQS